MLFRLPLTSFLWLWWHVFHAWVHTNTGSHNMQIHAHTHTHTHTYMLTKSQQGMWWEDEAVFVQIFLKTGQKNTFFSQVLAGNMMLLCNSESFSVMLYYCWNPVLFNKSQLGMKQEMSEVCTVTAIRQSLFQLASSVSSPSSLSVTSCLVSRLVPRRSISGGGLRSATRPRAFPSGF